MKRGWFEILLERFGGVELLQLLLLGFTFGCAGLGLSVVITRLSSGFMLLLAALGVLTAWTLSRTRLPQWGFGLLGFALGLAGLCLTVGRIGHPLMSLLSGLFSLPGQLLQKQPTDFSATANAWQVLVNSVGTLAARIINWFNGIQAHTVVTDPMVTSMLWGMALWLSIFWGMWWVRRRAVASVGLFPTVVLLGYNVFYTTSSAGITWLVLTVGGILALQATIAYGSARQGWVARRVEQDELDLRLAFLVFIVAVSMMLAGGILPTIPVHKIAHAIDTAIQRARDQSLARSLGLEQTPIGGSPGQVTLTPAYGDTIHTNEYHPIGPGPGPDLNQTVVMLVSVDGYNPPPTNEYVNVISQYRRHYYWRAQTFDTYNNRSWIANNTRTDETPASQSLRADVDLASLSANYTRVIEHVTRLASGDQTVFAAGELLSLDQPSTVVRRDDGEIVSAFTASNQYTVISFLPSPSVEELRAAGSNYPDSVRRYLELPGGIPQRVLDLALNLTADQPTPYDKAAVLEAYLRQFPYSREVPAPPWDRDAVDFFLFNLKTGYCDYYASAMAVMARAAGLPARLVLGYSEGTYDATQKAFVVRASNAHAWVEIYFPGIGWVGFEPTASQPLPFRPGQMQGSGQTNSLPVPGQEAPLSFRLLRTWLGRRVLGLFAIVVVILLIPFLPLEKWWLTMLPTDQALTMIFRRLYRRGRSFGIPSNPSRTPNEFAFALDSALDGLTADGKRAPLIAALRTDLDNLTNLYTRLLFTQHPLQEMEKREAIQIWARIRRGFRRVRQFE